MGSVYLVGEWGKDNVYKIGVTRGSIENRIKKLQTGNSNEIYIVSHFSTNHPFIMEKMLHDRYYDKHINGEWFELTPEEATSFKRVCEDIQETINVLEEENYYFRKRLGK